MPTKLSLKYQIISGPYGNVFIQTKIDGEPEELPFKSIYLKESPKEVLKNLGRNYNVAEYKDIELNEASSFNYKKHYIHYGLSIKESNLEGVIIKNKIKNVKLSFLPKLSLSKEELQGKVKSLIGRYIVTTHTEYGPIMGGFRFDGDDGRGPRPSYEEQVTNNYFQDRKNNKDELKEKQLSQILEYAQVILNKPDFSIKNLEEMVSEKATAV